MQRSVTPTSKIVSKQKTNKHEMLLRYSFIHRLVTEDFIVLLAREMTWYFCHILQACLPLSLFALFHMNNFTEKKRKSRVSASSEYSKVLWIAVFWLSVPVQRPPCGYPWRSIYVVYQISFFLLLFFHFVLRESSPTFFVMSQCLDNAFWYRLFTERMTLLIPTTSVCCVIQSFIKSVNWSLLSRLSN